MSKSFRLGVILLSAVAVVVLSNPHATFGQRFKASGSNQSNKDKDKDNDEDKDRKDKKDKKDQGNPSNQSSNQNAQNTNSNNNQGNSNNQGGNPSNPGNPKKSGTSGTPQQFKQFIQNKNQNDQDKDKDKKYKKIKQDDQVLINQGQGGTNKIIGPGQPGFPNQNPNQQKIAAPFGPGGAQPVNKQFGSWKGDKWQGSHKVDNWSNAFGHKKPFSAEWYNDHPRAWRYDNRRSNVWVVATVPGVYSWLGWGNVPPQYQVGYNNGPRFDPSLYGEWYPLGVYSLMTGPDDVGTRVLQLAVDRRGRINGNYFDMITDSDHGVSGLIDQQTQRAEWTLNQNPNVRFRASIVRLLQPYGTVTVQLPGGEQRWQFVRLENE